ncbi:MAG: SRPBCC family protein [Chthoniobacterales bacterium]
MKQLLLISILVFARSTFALADDTEKTASAAWKEEASAHGVAIYSRMRAGTSLKEFKGVGLIEMPPAVVFAVLDDTQAYPTFMPYTAECRVLKREGDEVVAYQRLDLPFVSDRDYTLESKHERGVGPDGHSYRIHWQAANELGPAVRPGVQRVKFCQGGWLLEPQGPHSTRATYSIFTDSGGALPAFIANNGSRIAIRKIFDAVRKQAKDAKYSGAH